jgi:hypothetical protein
MAADLLLTILAKYTLKKIINMFYYSFRVSNYPFNTEAWLVFGLIEVVNECTND